MKKLTVALLTVASLAAVSANASLYAGLKLGNASYHNNVSTSQKLVSKWAADQKFKTKNGGASLGLVLGTKLNSNVAVEAVLETLGSNSTTYSYGVGGTNAFVKQKSYGLGLNAKYIIPVSNFDFFALGGVELVKTTYTTDAVYSKIAAPKSHARNFTYVLGLGASYHFTPSVALTFEYKYLGSAGKQGAAKQVGLPLTSLVSLTKENKAIPTKYKPSVNVLSFGLNYTFGNSAAPVVTSEDFSLSSDLTFAFGSDKLAKSADAAVTNVAAKAATFSDVTYQIVGHTDRIGSASFNQSLSERRALAVANVLVSKGVDASVIKASGVGSAQPVTNGCNDVKGKNAQIACLAPDRRVQVTISGVKK